MKWAILLILITLLPACDKNQDCEEVAWAQSLHPPEMTVATPKVDLQVSNFQSCQEFQEYALERFEQRKNHHLNGGFGGENTCSASFDNQTQIPEAQPVGNDQNQPTNTQEAGVDESDRVKISRDYIFYARENSIAVINRSTKEFVQSIESPGYWRPYIYVASEHLIVIRPHEKPVLNDPEKEKLLDQNTQPVVFRNPLKFDVLFYDLSENFREVKRKTVLGSYIDSRMTRNGVLTLITQTSATPELDEKRNKDYLNVLTSNIDCSKISRPVLNDMDLSLTSVHSFDTNNLKSQYKETHLIGAYNQVYMNNNLYLTRSKNWFWFDDRPLATDGDKFTVRLDLENNQWVEKARINYGGRTPSVWSFKEIGKYFYIATTDNNEPGGLATHFSVYENSSQGMELKNVITGIAPGERLRAARLTDEFAYLVTFRTMDPLFVIDLKVKDDPRVVSELKIPGFSSYLHTTIDNRLIGVGYSGDTSQLQLSLFDVNDPLRPSVLEQRLISDGFSSSEAQHDHHSFFYDDDWQTMAVPIYTSSYSRNWQSVSQKTGAYFYSLNQNHFFHMASLTHSDWMKQHCDLSPNDYGWAIYPGSQDISRIHRIDGDLMTFSDFGARVHNRQDPNIELNRTLFNKPQEACPKPTPACMVLL